MGGHGDLDTSLLLTAMMSCCLVLPGPLQGLKISGPALPPSGDQMVLKAGETLRLRCRGDPPLSWSVPEAAAGAAGLSERRGACGAAGCVTLTLRGAEARHTGRFACAGRAREAAVYVFVSDPRSPFVAPPSEVPEVLYVTEGRELVIPCRVTAPDVRVALRKFPGLTLTPDGRALTWDATRGFVAPRAGLGHVGLLSCEAAGARARFLALRRAHSIRAVRVRPAGPVRLLRGQNLRLTCSARAGPNARVRITWEFPGKASGRPLHARQWRAPRRGPGNVFLSELRLPRVQRADAGSYVCHVHSGERSRAARSSVRVYGRPFLRVRPRGTRVQETVSGRRVCRVGVRVSAFPPPQALWLKDGRPAASLSPRYAPRGPALLIRDVRPEDAGAYTVRLRAGPGPPEANRTVRLVVNVRPRMDAAPAPPPAPLPRGSRQALTCAAHGVPAPALEWLWQPCARNRTRDGPGPCPAVDPPVPVQRDGRGGNSVAGVTSRTVAVGGVSKTESTLLVAAASVSGIFHCRASNKVGAAQRSLSFRVADGPDGPHAPTGRPVAEGKDPTPSCSPPRLPVATDAPETRVSPGPAGPRSDPPKRHASAVHVATNTRVSSIRGRRAPRGRGPRQA